MQYIDIYDYLLLPIYLIIFYFIIILQAKKFKEVNLRKFFVTAFFLHILGSFLYCMVVQYYYGYGDSLGFYQGSNFIRKVITSTGNPIKPFLMTSTDYINQFGIVSDTDFTLPTGIDVGSNLTIMKISAFLSYFAFNSYLVISLFLGLFAFAGLWKLFCTLNEITEKKIERMLAFAVLYTPSIWFWGSGLMKESVCIGAIGFIVHYTHKILVKKNVGIRRIIYLVAMLLLLIIVKNYLASALFVASVLSYLMFIILKSKKNPIQLLSVIIVLAISTSILIATLSYNIETIIDDSRKNIESFSRAYANAENDDERSMASFSGGAVSNNLNDIILGSPVAIFTTLFRPFIWETKKPMMVFSALESLIMLLATIYILVKCRVWKFFYYVFSDPYVFFCFVITLVLGVIIGFSTFNFGTLVRYRLPILPFYFFMLLSIYLKTKAPLKKT